MYLISRLVLGLVGIYGTLITWICNCPSMNYIATVPFMGIGAWAVYDLWKARQIKKAFN